jgi:hypothetical protein
MQFVNQRRARQCFRTRASDPTDADHRSFNRFHRRFLPFLMIFRDRPVARAAD